MKRVLANADIDSVCIKCSMQKASNYDDEKGAKGGIAGGGGGEKNWQGHLAELHDDVHHVALLVALIVLDNVGMVQAVQHLHLILCLQTAALLQKLNA